MIHTFDVVGTVMDGAGEPLNVTVKNPGGTVHRPCVEVRDRDLTPEAARGLAALLVAAAKIAEAQERRIDRKNRKRNRDDDD